MLYKNLYDFRLYSLVKNWHQNNKLRIENRKITNRRTNKSEGKYEKNISVLINSPIYICHGIGANGKANECGVVGSSVDKTMACTDVLTPLVVVTNRIDDCTLRKVTIPPSG